MIFKIHSYINCFRLSLLQVFVHDTPTATVEERYFISFFIVTSDILRFCRIFACVFDRQSKSDCCIRFDFIEFFYFDDRQIHSDICRFKAPHRRLDIVSSVVCFISSLFTKHHLPVVCCIWLKFFGDIS